MNCPACKESVEKLGRGGLCPNLDCKAPLKIVEREEDGIKIKTLSFRKNKDVFREDDVEGFETIYDNDGIKVEKSNKGNYLVTFYKRHNFGWIYCPNCQSKMFQNNTLRGSNEHKCHKCKTVTTYIFE